MMGRWFRTLFPLPKKEGETNSRALLRDDQYTAPRAVIGHSASTLSPRTHTIQS